MANERRVRQGFLSGLIDDNPLSNSATTLNSTELAGLEAIDSTEHAVIVLDPTGAGNGPEVAYVTAHTGSATSATIVRGREGTTGVQHASTITWVHVPTVHDYIQTLNNADKPSTGGVPYEGQSVAVVDKDRFETYSGSAWERGPHWGVTGRTGFAIQRTATQSVNDGSTFTNISWDTEDFDSDSYFAATSATVTIPSGLDGLYIVTFTVNTGYPTNGSAALQRIIAGGITHSKGYASYNAGGTMSIGPLPLAAADTITCGVAQTVGGAANFTARLWGYRIGR